MIARILIVAGSDSSGGAGIQADLRTVQALGGYGMTAVTAVTVQNTLGVKEVFPIPAHIVEAQLLACLDDIGADAVKIGMLGTEQIANSVFDVIAYEGPKTIVFDPVMVATSGDALNEIGTFAQMAQFISLATIVTPNAPELSALTDTEIEDEADLLLAAQELLGQGARAVLAKGGHLAGAEVVDWLVTPQGQVRFASPRIETQHTHGTGCTLASALAVGLAHGLSLEDASRRARDYVYAAILAAPGFGRGHGPLGIPK